MTHPTSFKPSIARRLEARAETDPDRTALVDRVHDRRWTFAELVEEAERLSRQLEGADGPTALALDNTLICPWFFAARSAGLPVVLMDAEPSPDAKRDLCRRLGIRRLVHRPAGGDSPRAEVVVEELAVELPRRPPGGTDIVKLSSGSTGEPSGACFSEQELILGVEQIARGMEITERDSVLLVVPMTHSYGFDNGLLSLALLGTPLVIERGFFPRQILRGLEATDATVLPLVPPLVRALGQIEWPRLPALRRVICAGGILPPRFAEDFRRASGLRVHNFFGSSETGGICFETRPDDPSAAGTVGFPLPGVSVELGPGGEVRVDSGANLRARWGDRQARPKSGRRVDTGDLGEWTDEGRLRLVGRAAHRLNLGGRKVSVAEIEKALRRLDGVEEAAVVGVRDDMRGDRVVAFVVAREWPVDLRALPKRIRPRECRPIAALPVTPRGKLDRKALRRLLEQPAAPVVRGSEAP